MPDSTAAITRRQRAEYAALLAPLAAARAAIDAAVHGSTDRQDEAEQSAYDALVDWVEANDLNFTALDPRGTAAELDALNAAGT